MGATEPEEPSLQGEELPVLPQTQLATPRPWEQPAFRLSMATHRSAGSKFNGTLRRK